MDLYISIITYYCTVGILPITLWRSKKNISFFQGFPFICTAYILGGFYFIDIARKEYSVDAATEESFAYILLLGTISHLLGYIIGFYSKGYLYKKIETFLLFSTSIKIEKILKVGRSIAIISIFLFILSFLGMKIIPALADDPFQAKYMSGIYQEAYRPFAIPYRMALNLSNMSLVFLFVSFPRKSKCIDAVLAFILVVCLTLTLRRGLIAMPIVYSLFCYFSFKSTRAFSVFCLLYFLLFLLGGAFNDVFLYYINFVNELNFISILKGMPDISDQLFFLDNWINHQWTYTFGTNFFGGLIPYHSEYNLSVLTLNVTGSIAGDVASGGFRLPVAMIGYVAFGWIGVIGVSGIFAYITGTVLSCQKKYLEKCDLTTYTLINFICFDSILSVLSDSFGRGISIDKLFIAVLAVFMLLKLKYKIVIGK